jgi:hypothetical protein
LRSKKSITLAGILALLAVLAPGHAAAAQPRAKLDLRLERTRVLVENAYRTLPPIGPEGQLGVNRSGAGFSLSHQQHGDLFVRAGLIRGERRLVGRGFRAFDYAFKRQRKNGRFPSEDQAEAYAFFLQSVAHSVLLVRASGYAGRFESRMDRYVKRLRRASDHIIARDAWADFARRNRRYTHSGYVMGAALALTGQVTRRRDLRRYGRKALRLALDNQRASGVNPELGGYDVRYQMAGITYAERFSVYFPGDKLARRVHRMTNRGLAWMSQRIDSNGYINWRGSTRTCSELASDGRPKTPGYHYAIRGFAYWGAYRGRPAMVRAAKRMQYYLEHRSGGSLCSPKAPSAASSNEGTSRQGLFHDLFE